VIEVRPADLGDGLVVRELLGQLGYAFTVDDMRARLALFAKQPADPVLLATEHGRVVGLIAMHWTPMLHHSKPVARIGPLAASVRIFTIAVRSRCLTCRILRGNNGLRRRGGDCRKIGGRNIVRRRAAWYVA